jgi:hypothetical protein
MSTILPLRSELAMTFTGRNPLSLMAPWLGAHHNDLEANR